MDLVAAWAIVVGVLTLVSMAVLSVSAVSAWRKRASHPDSLKGLRADEVRYRLTRAAEKGECPNCWMGTFAPVDTRIEGSNGVVDHRCSNCGFEATEGPGWWSL